MKLCLGALWLLCFIQKSLGSPSMNDVDCLRSLDYDMLFQSQIDMLDTGGICNQNEIRLNAHKKGMEHAYNDLTSSLNHSILIGGYWTIPNFLWNAATNHQCHLKKINTCRPDLWLPLGILINCSDSIEQSLNWSQRTLHQKFSKLERLIPNTEVKSALPFPNLFNVTILDIKQSDVCQKQNSIVCHKQMSQHGGHKSRCSYYFCHTTEARDMIEITVKYENTNTTVSILMMCHTLPGNTGIPDDTKCHFLKPQTSFVFCDKE
ncbi:unnamed protein product [Didymodactylos carnosus]|uniref:Uncharacterized protein n=1 Tax=Didymodactylos carnosus TaxID=1234261 RepID=A0A815VYW9_9BILA|nr:unnamed protein product [Didymodactylos carnosus]CAF1541794.1 unnamed protein product [Didymodactylos carnosus]CAF3613449.1 unnamed protein product [Didymodactylos carnosus]CAF4402198.1 unnamed protein product [Didymodactylos carnosus]